MCFELGRFPYELPAGLPDEQITLMLAYLELRHEMSSDRAQQSQQIHQARAATDALEAERAAWRAQQGVPNG